MRAAGPRALWEPLASSRGEHRSRSPQHRSELGTRGGARLQHRLDPGGAHGSLSEHRPPARTLGPGPPVLWAEEDGPSSGPVVQCEPVSLPRSPLVATGLFS